MSGYEVIGILDAIPPSIKDIGAIIIVLSLVEIAPVKVNPWKWIKDVYHLPERLNTLEKDFNNDRAFRWRSQILRRADYVMDGQKFSRETWDDTIETIDNYEKYCKKHEDYQNGKATVAIEFLKDTYKEVIKNNDFLSGGVMPE